jgi:DegV family protein with EDD domain
MSRVTIVTDSTAYLPRSAVDQYGINVIPLSIIWEGASYRDGVDIQPNEFYRRLKEARELPTTSQVTAPAFESAFTELLERGDCVLAVIVSSKLSGTYDAAVQARNALSSAQDKIAVVDSRLTTVAMAMPVLAAARAAQAGESLDSCKALAERACDQSGVLFVVETLEFMRRGGRIGGAAAFLGTALNIKPLLGMRDGQIEAVQKIRTKRAALDRMIDLTVERVGGRKPVRLATSHADHEADAMRVLEAASARLDPIETLCRPLSPVIGSHVGPGTVALAYMVGID